jgi:transcriptional regulator with XRE-family HTH domain
MLFRGIELDPKQLGNRIRQARERLRISQDELAVMVSKDQRAISEYENGKRKLAATDLPAFAEALEVSILYFYEGESDTQDLDNIALSEFHRLSSPKARQVAIEIMRLLSEAID